MTKILYLMRSISGAGKSYLASQLAKEVTSSVICSADYYFICDGKYNFNPAKLGLAHEQCQRLVREAMEKGVERVIVDNTNTTRKEMVPYAKLAIEFGYELKFATPDTPWAWDVSECAKRNQHGVPIEALQRMKDRFDHKITPTELLESVRPPSMPKRNRDYDEGFIVQQSRIVAIEQCQAKYQKAVVGIVPIVKNGENIEYLVDLLDCIQAEPDPEPLIQKGIELYVRSSSSIDATLQQLYKNTAFKVLGCVDPE